jgi:lauroyl/myristoyl acyltransferase
LKNPERFINNGILRAVANNLDFRLSQFIVLKALLPFIIPENVAAMLAQNVSCYLKEFFPFLSDEEVERKVDAFLWHYKYKFSEDCIVLNLNFDKSLKVIEKYTAIHGKENLMKALDQGRGVLAVGSHVGSVLFGTMTFLSVFLTLEGRGFNGIKVCTEPDVIQFPSVFQRLEKAFKQYNYQFSFIITRRHKKDVAMEIANALRAGSIVTTNMDVVMGGRSRMQFRLFEKALVYLPALAGAVKVALQTGATILPWTNIRDKGGHLILTIEEPIIPLHHISGKIDNDDPEFIRLREKLRAILERWITDDPEQWMYWDRLHHRLINKNNLFGNKNDKYGHK